MINIAEIFRWYRDSPKIPRNLTTIQKEEWNSNHFEYFNKTFVGVNISNCLATISDIKQDEIIAFAIYHLDYLVSHDGTHYHYEKNVSRDKYAQIYYQILYNKDNFYDKVKSINSNDMVEFSGTIKNVTWKLHDTENNLFTDPDFFLSIKLSLSSISQIENRFLHAELLDDNLSYKLNFKNKMNEFGCFIATVCYGDYDATEVIVLRQYRDDKLLKTTLGKLFVKLYYSVSPFFARLISKSDILKKIIKEYFLEPIVTALQRQNKKRL